MLFSAIGAVSERLDSKFITAYFFPAFLAVLGTIWIFITAAGGERFGDRIASLDSAEQAIAVGVLLLLTMMLAHMLRAMARPIMQLFAGRVLPTFVKKPATRGQLRARARARIVAGAVSRIDRLYPRDPDETESTSFGNAVAAAGDYPRLVYAMEMYHWWPRLLPLLPAEFQELLHSMETPMRAMLNLSLVFLYLGCLAAVALGLANSQLLTAIVALVAGLVLSHFCYRAAVSQATELVRNIWVAFDLYRSEILKQLGFEVPSDFEEERALWQRLAQRGNILDEAFTMAGSQGQTAPAAPTPMHEPVAPKMAK